MENKDLIITALIILVIYLAYQQQNNQNDKQSPNIVESPNTQELRSELNHCQTLYQARIEKDLGDEEKVKELTETKNDLEKQLDLTQQDLKNAQENSQELEILLENKEQTNQEQLRKINVLFDEQAKNYQTIDFNGLYSLLRKIAERERERERESKIVDYPEVENENKTLSHKDKRKSKKKKKK